MSGSFGSVSKEAVEIDCWLSVHPGNPKAAWNRRPSIRVTASEPKLDRLERAINLRMSLPLALFETPNIVASINVDAPRAPVQIDASSVAEAVRQVVGMDVHVSVVEPEQGS